MRIRTLICILFICIVGCVSVIHHDHQKAIETTNLFLRELIREDYLSAYKYVSDILKKELTFEKFVIDLRNSRKSRGEFTKAIFDSYQYVLGQRAIQLYYCVDHKEVGDVLYHFVLEGDKKTGYKICFVDIGNQVKYPPGVKYINEPKRQKLDRYIEVTGD